MTWLLRSTDQSLSATAESSECDPGMDFDPGSPAAFANSKDVQAHQIRDEQEEPAASSDEFPLGKRKCAHVGNRLHSGAEVFKALLIESPRERGETFLPQDVARRSRRDADSAFMEGSADVPYGVVVLTQRDHFLADCIISADARRTADPGSPKEVPRGRVVAEVVTKHTEGARGVAEGPGGLRGGAFLAEEGAEGLVLALPRRRRHPKEVGEAS